MLTIDEIKKLATKLQTTELNVQRELVQHQFLRFFYQQKESSTVFFKGGTALRIVYHSPRFSEDLDFDSEMSLSQLEDIIESTLAQMDRDGLSSEILESKSTSGGYLGIIEINGLLTKLEISNRSKSAGEIFTVIDDFTIPYNLFAVSKTDLVTGKITALLSRGKPRDFFDLYFMLRSNMVGAVHKKQAGAILNQIKSTEIDFAKELKIFLPKSHWAVISDFKEILLREFQNNF